MNKTSDNTAVTPTVNLFFFLNRKVVPVNRSRFTLPLLSSDDKYKLVSQIDISKDATIRFLSVISTNDRYTVDNYAPPNQLIVDNFYWA